MYRRESRPIYGRSQKKSSEPTTNSCVCPEDLMTMLLSLHTVIDAFFPAFEGMAQITPGMKATADVSPSIFVRIVWFYRTFEKHGKRIPFPKQWEPNYAEEVLHLKDIYYEFEFDPETDFLFAPTSRTIVNMTNEEIDKQLEGEVEPNTSNTTTM